MKFRNELAKQSWDEIFRVNQIDEYSKAAVAYAQRWAEMMEKGLETGLQLKDIWHDFGFQADTEGITGFMYGMACEWLTKLWFKGDELRILHNAYYGVTDPEASAVNPAIVTVDVPDGETVENVISEKLNKAGIGHRILNRKEIDKILEKGEKLD